MKKLLILFFIFFSLTTFSQPRYINHEMVDVKNFIDFSYGIGVSLNKNYDYYQLASVGFYVTPVPSDLLYYFGLEYAFITNQNKVYNLIFGLSPNKYFVPNILFGVNQTGRINYGINLKTYIKLGKTRWLLPLSFSYTKEYFGVNLGIAYNLIYKVFK